MFHKAIYNQYENMKTVVYDRVPVTLVHPQLESDLTLFYVLLPRGQEREKVMHSISDCLTRLRSIFNQENSLVQQVEEFLCQLTWTERNHLQVNAIESDQWFFFPSEDIVSDYDLRILFTLFPREMPNETFRDGLLNL